MLSCHGNNTVKKITFALCLLLAILLSIRKLVYRGQAPMHQLLKRNGNQDILSIIFKNIDTAELIRWYCNPPTGVCIKKVSEELGKRVITMDERKKALFDIYDQSQNGHAISDAAADKISEMVRIKVQQQVDDESRDGFCFLSPCPFRQHTGIVSDKLLKALAHFNKSIFVPSSVVTLMLDGLDLTSLWLRFKQDSRIKSLHLHKNNFKELNYRTFGQFIHPTARQGLKQLFINENKEIAAIDFEELKLPNIKEFSATGCVSLLNITNIQRSVMEVWIQRTNIKEAAQFQFKNQTGNALKNVYCDTDVGDDFKQVLSSLFPEEKSGYAEYFGQGHWRRED